MSPTRAVLWTLAGLAALGAVAAAAVIGLGLYNVSARAPHLPPVRWALHTTYENAVRLRAPAASAVPDDLADPARVALGARHFDAACRMCHAAPGERQTATVERMRPEPPHVTAVAEGWQARHLHWILLEGVKMSGMPAWPAPREDEPWSAVAFLKAAREMDEASYAALTARPDVDGPFAETFAYCAGCHGADGLGDLGPFVPRLDILEPAYIALALEAYRSGARASGYMRHAASEPPPEALAAMAARFGALPLARPGPEPGPEPGPAPDPALLATGERLARAGTADDPACVACHGPPALARAAYPNLAGQHEAYLVQQLRLWRDGERGGGRLAHLMRAAAEDLADDEIAALAAWYAALPPSRPAAETAAR